MSVREIRGWTPATPVPQSPQLRARRDQPARDGAADRRLGVAAGLSLQPSRPPVTPSWSPRSALRSSGLLVDGVSDIFTITPEQIQPTPDVASEMAKSFVSGVIVMDGRLIGLITLENLLPPLHLKAA